MRPVQASKQLMIVAAALGLLILASCQKAYTPINGNPSGQASDMTGGQTPDGKLLTAASDDGGIQILKDAIPETQDGNHDLAISVHNIHVELQNQKGEATSSNPQKLKIEITLKGPQDLNLSFNPSLKGASSGALIFQNAPAKETTDYKLSGVCSDKTCAKVVMRLSLQSKTSQKAAAGFIYRLRNEVEIRTTGASTAETFKNAPALSSVQRALQAGAKESSLQTLEVAWGAALFSLRFKTDGQKQYCLSGRLVETNDDDETLQIYACDGTPTGLTAMMIGNDNAGSLIVRLQEKDATLFVLVLSKGDKVGGDVGGKKPPVEEPAPPPTSEDASALAVDPNHPITKVFEADRNRPEVMQEIRFWTLERPKSVRQFIATIQPNMSVIKKALAPSGVPIEMIAITLIESGFFYSPGYPVEVPNDLKSSAAGPWQFQKGTAEDYGLKAMDLTKDRKANPCDERGLLEPSTRAAGKHFKRLFTLFDDPRLGVMSYFWGEGYVGCLNNPSQACAKLLKVTQDRLQAIKQAKFDFWSVKDFNMVRKDAAKYVVQFLAAQFVIREPHRYGLQTLAPAEVALIKPAQEKNPSCK